MDKSPTTLREGTTGGFIDTITIGDEEDVDFSLGGERKTFGQSSGLVADGVILGVDTAAEVAGLVGVKTIGIDATFVIP